MADEAPNELALLRQRRAEQQDDEHPTVVTPFVFDVGAVGVAESEDRPVVIVLDRERNIGVSMSAEDALSLGATLVNAARSWLFGDDDAE